MLSAVTVFWFAFAADGMPPTLAPNKELDGKLLFSARAKIDSISVSNGRRLVIVSSHDKAGSQIASYTLPFDAKDEPRRYSTPFRVKSVTGFEGADKLLLLSEMKLQTVDAKSPIPLGEARAVWEGNLDTFDKTPRILRNEFIRLNRTDGAVVIESFGSSGRHAVSMWHDRQLIFARQGKLGSVELPIAPFNLSVSGICAAIDPSAANPVRIAVGLSTMRHYSEELRKKLVESPPELAALEALKLKGNEPRPLMEQMKKDIEDASTGLERLMLFEMPSMAPELVGREILSRPMSVLGKKMNLEPVGFSPDGKFLYVHCKYMETKSSPKPVHGLVRIDLANAAKGRDSRELIAGASDDEQTFLLRLWITFSRKDQLFASYLTEVRPTERDTKITTSLMVVDLATNRRYRLTCPGITSDVLASGRLPATFLPDRTFAMAINDKVVAWKVP